MKIYIANKSKCKIGGGFTFERNFRDSLAGKVDFVDRWHDSDIVFIFGITVIDKPEIYSAIKAGKKVVLRVDNIPRKSRNKRMDPAARLTDFGKLASLVVYQSEWCKKYAGYFSGEGIVINNGVNTKIFNTKGRKTDGKTYLYINYNDNPNKRFDEAIYRFEMLWREDHDNHLIIAGKAPTEFLHHPEFNWDLNVPALVEYAGILDTPQMVAEAMKDCDYILYPSFADGYPNTLLEALACGLKPLYLNEEGGSVELYNDFREQGVKDITGMGQEYLEAFNQLIKK